MGTQFVTKTVVLGHILYVNGSVSPRPHRPGRGWGVTDRRLSGGDVPYNRDLGCKRGGYDNASVVLSEEGRQQCIMDLSMFLQQPSAHAA